MKVRRFARFSWMALALLLAGAPGTAAPAQGEPGSPTDLTLAAAVTLALERHPALRAAGVDQARAAFLPRVDFSEGITRSDNPVYAFGALLNQGRFTQTDLSLRV